MSLAGIPPTRQIIQTLRKHPHVNRHELWNLLQQNQTDIPSLTRAKRHLRFLNDKNRVKLSPNAEQKYGWTVNESIEAKYEKRFASRSNAPEPEHEA